MREDPSETKSWEDKKRDARDWENVTAQRNEDKSETEDWEDKKKP